MTLKPDKHFTTINNYKCGAYFFNKKDLSTMKPLNCDSKDCVPN